MKRKYLPFVFILPSLLLLMIIIMFPMIFSLRNSFMNWNLQLGPNPMGFVGFSNYAIAIGDPTFTKALLNTVKLSFFATAVEFILGLGVALLLNERLKGSKVVRAIIIMPTTIAPMIAGFIFRFLYYSDGLIPYLFSLVGVHLPKEGVLGNASTALLGVGFTDIWQWTPFFAIILLAGLQSIPTEILEAAKVDGASYVKTFVRIMLPNLAFVTLIIVMIRFMQVFNVFDIIYAETMGGPGTASRTLSYNLYYRGLVEYNIGYSSAIAWIMMIIVAIMINLFTLFAFRGKEL
jgi:multiple sugar transport system permease protein